MSGPTWKFWMWTAADWPFGIVCFVCAAVFIVTFGSLVIDVVGGK